MSKNKTQSSKKPNKKKNLFAKIAAGLVLLAFVAYYVLSQFVLNESSSPKNKELENAVNNYTAYSFHKDGELSFLDAKGTLISKIDIEIADTDEKRELGLMYRDKMEENRGMLFIFPQETYQSFWMKNTIIPLDMIFINANKEIIKIQKNTIPYSEQSYSSEKPAKYVIEVNAGYCDRHGIKEGNKITWRVL
ncbi:DUF192 domain-containing protein [Melioribacteraceae bacterium 4301-Me]|uniref:DUF192 domain-containing protein n=1 Tax=Pyranulibacter aquaticus TaxID=3163344 RepID=UPI00359A903E